jgi:hypothetical protein
MIAHMGYRVNADLMASRRPVFEYGEEKFEFPLVSKSRYDNVREVEKRLKHEGIHVMIFRIPDAKTKFIIGHSFPY